MNKYFSIDDLETRDGFARRQVKPCLTYLACPYTHRDAGVQEARYIHATRAAAWLMDIMPWNVFSPITHSHPLHTIAGMRGDWPFWKQVDKQYLRLSERLVVLTLPGWDDSVGVKAEIEIARAEGVPLWYLCWQGENNYLLSANSGLTSDEI
jgi:hypothetical protein